MTSNEPSAPAGQRKRTWLTILSVLACCASAALLAAMAYRPVTSVDLGYHLAYGERFLQTGEIVSDDSFIAPPVTPGQAGDQLPPGAYFDDHGNYHFPNANWLTQVILAWLFDHGGWRTLNVTLIAMIALIAIAQAAILRRLGVPWGWLAGVWLVAAWVGYERFMVRPELFAFVCLIWQIWLLAERVTWPKIIAFVALQILAVNLHSYWLLGVGIAGAFFCGAIAQWAWAKWIAADRTADPHLRRRFLRLTVCLAAMAPAAMVHPAGPANAIYPFRTLTFLRAHAISGQSPDDISGLWRAGKLHPWQTIGEFQRPFTPDAHHLMSTRALKVLLVLSAASVIVLLVARQWALAALLVGFSLTALSMRRNMVIPALAAGPLIAAAGHAVCGWWRTRHAESAGGRIALACVLACSIALAGWGVFDVASDRLYLRERRTTYFGQGLSRLTLPVGVCEWLDANLPSPQPVFADQNISSTILAFSESVTGVPTLTNTWATPPARMAAVFDVGSGRLGLDTLDRWGLDIAVCQGWPINQQMIRSMLADDDWALVYLESWFAVFARRTEANAAMISANEITRETFDLDAFVAMTGHLDPLAPMAYKAGASLLQVMGWRVEAAAVWRACLAAPGGDEFHQGWLNLGICLAIDGGQKALAGDPAGMDDLMEARRCFQRALQLKGDYPQARRNLLQVERDILVARQGLQRR